MLSYHAGLGDIMRIIVIGAGVIGVTSAWYLARAGFEVTVLEREPDAALETSFANAGQISPGYAAPWAAPGVPFKALRWMLQRHSPLHISPDGSLWQWLWMAQMLRNCTAARYARNKSAMVQLAEYSRDSLRALREQERVFYEAASLGTLQVFRKPKQFQAAQRDMQILEACGVAHRLLDADGCVAQEPALAAMGETLVGGLYLPGDETGDCRMFTAALAEKAAQAGVQFRFGSTVTRLQFDRHRVLGAQIGDERLQADQYVLATASFTRALLQPLGLSVPVYPVKGYSLTAAIVDAAAAPRSTVLDETWKVAITRFDQRMRIGGMAELVGFDLRLNVQRRKTLAMVSESLFPGSCDLAQAQFWTGLRPMTPSGVPLIGRTAYDNLWLNTGHGTLGWTMACGSARLLTDSMAGKRPALSGAPFCP